MFKRLKLLLISIFISSSAFAGTCGGKTAYTCPNGGTLSGTTCTNSVSSTCAAGLSPDSSTGKCVANPTCPVSSGWASTFDGVSDICYTSYQTSCSSGVYDSTSNMCVVTPTCSNGALDIAADKCYQSRASGCPSNYNLSGATCQKTPTCNSSGIFDSAKDACTYAATFNCATGYGYNNTLSKCTRTADCSTPSALQTTRDKCETAFAYSCATGFGLSASTCSMAPTCVAPGTYTSLLDKCSASGSMNCSMGLTVDNANKVCFATADCGSGALDGAIDKCKAPTVPNCGLYSLDSANNTCYSSSVCNGNSYSIEKSRCELVVASVCGAYTFDAPDNKCVNAITCPSDPLFSENSSIAYSSTLNKCFSFPKHNCATNYTYNGGSIKMCEAIPICVRGVYQPTTDACFLQSYTCPVGDYDCHITSGIDAWCSPYKCTSGQCGIALCPDASSAVAGISDPSACSAVACDMSKPYNGYCGKNQCPTGFGVYALNGKCYQDVCPAGSIQQANGSCQNLQCPAGSTEVGGICLVN